MDVQGGRLHNRTGSIRNGTGTTAVIGAGPHGLAATVHLRAAGVDTHCFGEPMEFWRRQMPAGMILRSQVRSSSISDPRRELTIEQYTAKTGRRVHAPNLTLDEFIDYGCWFQAQAVPDVDRRTVTTVTSEQGRFRLNLSDGTCTEVGRLVVAAGISCFPRGLAIFDHLPDSIVSHSSAHDDLARFAGQRVAVVGAGQSALESAALLYEAGVQVEVLARAANIRWLDDGESSPGRSMSLGPPTDVGGPVAGWLAAAPDIFRRLPHRLADRLAYRCIRPAGSGWLRPRLSSARISTRRLVVGAHHESDHVELALDDGSVRTVDHVLLCTGFEVDVRRYPFLSSEISDRVHVAAGYPVLSAGLESSVPGLHFLGAPAALSFGPVMRFVVGTWYDAPALTRRAVGQRQPLVRFSF